MSVATKKLSTLIIRSISMNFTKYHTFEDSIHVGYDAKTMGDWQPTFVANIVSSSSRVHKSTTNIRCHDLWTYGPLKMSTLFFWRFVDRDEHTMLPPNVWFKLHHEMMSSPWRMESSATTLQESCNSHILYFFSDTLNSSAILNSLTVHKIIIYDVYILCMLQSALIKKNADQKIYINILQWSGFSVHKT
jgi:hypothetical protein